MMDEKEISVVVEINQRLESSGIDTIRARWWCSTYTGRAGRIVFSKIHPNINKIPKRTYKIDDQTIKVYGHVETDWDDYDSTEKKFLKKLLGKDAKNVPIWLDHRFLEWRLGWIEGKRCHCGDRLNPQGECDSCRCS